MALFPCSRLFYLNSYMLKAVRYERSIIPEVGPGEAPRDIEMKEAGASLLKREVCGAQMLHIWYSEGPNKAFFSLNPGLRI
jgi:hypothetical protein